MDSESAAIALLSDSNRDFGFYNQRCISLQWPSGGREQGLGSRANKL